MSTQVIYESSDVLIIGNGLAGNLAALKAVEEGASVIVLEQAHSSRCGNAGSGVDHIHGYLPPVHEPKGYRIEHFKYDKGTQGFFNLGFGNPHFTDLFAENSFEIITSMEKYGLKVRGYADSKFPEGFRAVYQFHSIPTTAHFDGRDIKPALSQALEQTPARVIDRAQAVELLKDGDRVSGAIAISTREDKVYVISAKATILATSGGFSRIVPKNIPTQNKNEGPSAANYGAGAVLALKAGAELVNFEFALGGGFAGFSNFGFMAGAPGGTWYPAARVVDDAGNVVVDRLEWIDYDDPDYWAKCSQQQGVFAKGRQIIAQELKKGRQLYLDCSVATPEEIDYILWGLGNEGEMWLFREHLYDNNIDLRTVKLPLVYREKVTVASNAVGVGLFGVYVNEDFSTSVPGLYAAGAEQGASGALDANGAMTFGWLAGASAARQARQDAKPPAPPAADQVEALLAKLASRYAASSGDDWQDVEADVQSIVSVFGARPHSDERVHNALLLLADLQAKVQHRAADPWELSKTFEVDFLIEVARAVFAAIEHRPQSVAPFYQRSNNDGSLRPPLKLSGNGEEFYGLYKQGDSYAFTSHQGAVRPKPEGYIGQFWELQS
jgi:succinate dehydrogenase/fumarate reductase flavoprotein subunit